MGKGGQRLWGALGLALGLLLARSVWALEDAAVDHALRFAQQQLEPEAPPGYSSARPAAAACLLADSMIALSSVAAPGAAAFSCSATNF